MADVADGKSQILIYLFKGFGFLKFRQGVEKWRSAYETNVPLPSFSKFIHYLPYREALRRVSKSEYRRVFRYHPSAYDTSVQFSHTNRLRKPKMSRLAKQLESRKVEYRAARLLLGLIFIQAPEYRKKIIETWWSDVSRPHRFRHILTRHINKRAAESYENYLNTKPEEHRLHQDYSPNDRYSDVLSDYRRSPKMKKAGRYRKSYFVLENWCYFFQRPGVILANALSEELNRQTNFSNDNNYCDRYDALQFCGIMKLASPRVVIAGFLNRLQSLLSDSTHYSSGHMDRVFVSISDTMARAKQHKGIGTWKEPKPKKGRNTDVH